MNHNLFRADQISRSQLSRHLFSRRLLPKTAASLKQRLLRYLSGATLALLCVGSYAAPLSQDAPIPRNTPIPRDAPVPQDATRAIKSVPQIKSVSPLSSVSSKAPANPIESIRIGIAHGSFGSPPRSLLNPLTLAQRHELVEKSFADVGVKVQWIYFKGAGPAVNEAFSNHQIDFALQGDLPSIVGRAAGLKTRILLPLGQANTYIIVKKDSDIESLQQIRGKRFAFHKGTNMHVSVNKILHAAGLRESDVKFFNLDTIASIAAFHSGDLDGMFGGLNLLHLVDQGHAKLLYSTNQEDHSVTRTTLLGTEQFIAANPELTQRLVTALVSASDWIAAPEHYQATLELWQYGYITADMIHRDLNARTIADKFSPIFDARFTEGLRDSIAVADAARLIRRPVELSGWIDPRFLQQALRDLKLENRWQAKPKALVPDLRAHRASLMSAVTSEP